MLESFLITSRETLEASLVIGIVFAYLYRTKQEQHKKTAVWALIAGVLVSILAAVLFVKLAGGLTGEAEEIFEGITILAGAILLTTMILWVLKHKPGKALEKQLSSQLASKHVTAGIFLVVFAAIVREGVETVIFLNAARYAGSFDLLGAALGILAAAIFGYLFFASSKRFNLKHVFTISSILLILFAAGLVMHAVHALQEESAVAPLFDMSAIISEHSAFGGFLSGLFGYTATPTLLQLVAYCSYLGIIGIVYWRSTRARPQPRAAHQS